MHVNEISSKSQCLSSKNTYNRIFIFQKFNLHPQVNNIIIIIKLKIKPTQVQTKIINCTDRKHTLRAAGTQNQAAVLAHRWRELEGPEAGKC